MSRTASGTLDTTSSSSKAETLVEGVDGSVAASLVARNIPEAFAYVEGHAKSKISSFGIPNFIIEVAVRVNRGIVKDGSIMRTWDSNTIPYTPVSELGAAFDAFCRELYSRMDDSKSALETAAWIEYRVNIVDHFFGDGCGKVAMLLAAWMAMRHDLPLPDYGAGGSIPEGEARKRYFASIKGVPADVGEEQFFAMYRTFFP